MSIWESRFHGNVLQESSCSSRAHDNVPCKSMSRIFTGKTQVQWWKLKCLCCWDEGPVPVCLERSTLDQEVTLKVRNRAPLKTTTGLLSGTEDPNSSDRTAEFMSRIPVWQASPEEINSIPSSPTVLFLCCRQESSGGPSKLDTMLIHFSCVFHVAYWLIHYSYHKQIIY